MRRAAREPAWPGSSARPGQRRGLESEHIARVFDVGEHEDGSPYMVLEHLIGRDLEKVLEEGAIPVATAVDYVVQACLGLAAAHALRHHPPRPEAVEPFPRRSRGRYDNPQGARLRDFADAVAPFRDQADDDFGDAGHAALHVSGADARLAARCAHRHLGPRRHPLREFLSGRHPFDGATAADVFARILFEEAPPLRGICPHLPAALADIVQRCLEKQPSARPANVAELAKALVPFGTEETAFRYRRVARLAGQNGGPSAADRLLAEDRGESLKPVVRPVGGTPDADHDDRLWSAETVAAPSQRSLRWGRFGLACATLSVALATAAMSLRAQQAKSSAASAATTAALPCGNSDECGAAMVCKKAACVPRASVDCATNRECVARMGGPAICRPDTRACVPLESADCSVRAEPDDLANDETIWLGAMYPLSGPDGEDFGRAGANAFDLGRRDFREIAGGLPRKGSQGPARPIGIVVCDDARAPGSAREAARHLVDVGVPAVVGFHRSEEAIDLATSFFLPNRVLVVSTLNQSPLVTEVPQANGEPRLIWRTAVESGAWAEPIAHVLSAVAEPAVRATREPHDRSVRVALVTGGPLDSHNPAWLSFASALRGRLVSGRGPAAADQDDVREVFVPKKAGGTEGVDTEGVVRDLLEAPPHAVVIDNSIFGDVASLLEARWPTGLPRPFYVGTGGMVYPSMLRYFGKDHDRRRRFLAPELVVGSKANVLLAARYNEFFQPRVTQSFSVAALGAPYDAFYLLAYAVFAAGDGPPDGMRLAEAIPRLLPPGPTVDVGPTGIFDAIRALANGGAVDLERGAATPLLDFDARRPERHRPIGTCSVPEWTPPARRRRSCRPASDTGRPHDRSRVASSAAEEHGLAGDQPFAGRGWGVVATSRVRPVTQRRANGTCSPINGPRTRSASRVWDHSAPCRGCRRSSSARPSARAAPERVAMSRRHACLPPADSARTRPRSTPARRQGSLTPRPIPRS